MDNVKIIAITGDNYVGKWDHIRTSYRGIILRDNRVEGIDREARQKFINNQISRSEIFFPIGLLCVCCVFRFHIAFFSQPAQRISFR